MELWANNNLNWYAFRVESGQERKALSTLLKLGYSPFLPIERRRRRRHRYSKSSQVVEYAKFPGYIFVGFAGHVPWRNLWAIDRCDPLASTSDRPSPFIRYQDRVLKSVVGLHGKPSLADNQQIARAIAESAAYVPDNATSRKGFDMGDRVEIIDGAWQGFVTQVEGIHGDKARVFLKLFGTTRQVEIAVDALEAA